ncbi:MAG: uridine kinase, partial [Oscillospiraceae bacterium]|nr:uridine kinase [Oscillospiraceae bacterium]
MSKIVILRGNAGSGKTTISKALKSKIGSGTMLIPQDFIRMEMLGVEDVEKNPAISLLQNLVTYGHLNFEVVILEGILNKWHYQNLFKTIEEVYNKQIFAYYFDLPFEETLKRHTERNYTAFGEKEMREWWAEKDFIFNIKEKIITKEMSIDETVE